MQAKQYVPWQQVYKKKIIQPQNLEEWAAQIRAKKLRLATLNGSFDLLHAGHLHIIFEASQVADVLIVALNSDDSIKQYKSPKRPLVSLVDRLQMMAALEFVNYVTWFEELDPRHILSLIKPDVHVNGIEYGENCIEADIVRANGGIIHLASKIPGLSTSAIINKIKSE